MIVVFTSPTDVVYSFHALLGEEDISEVLLLLNNFERLNKGVLEKSRALEAVGGTWHENASHSDHISRSTSSSYFSLCDNFDHARDVTNRNLVAGLLNFDVLVRDKSRRLHLEDQLSVDFIRLALLRGTLDYWVELLCID